MSRPDHLSGRWGGINLRHLGSGSQAGIGDVKADFHLVATTRNLKIIKGKSCIAQAEAKGKLGRHVFGIEIAIADEDVLQVVHAVIAFGAEGVGRGIRQVFGPGKRQLA